MEEHPIAREEALAQLQRKAKDPTYEALKNFFDWLKNSYDLTDQQKYKKLEHAMAQQQLNWKHSPANDLRQALQQAQLSVEEISESKFLESSLRDLLKHRIDPAYYMQIYQTPIRNIPIQLNELWKHAALPTKHAYSETGKGPHILNVNSVKNILVTMETVKISNKINIKIMETFGEEINLEKANSEEDLQIKEISSCPERTLDRTTTSIVQLPTTLMLMTKKTSNHL